MIKAGQIHKTYWAVVKNPPPEESGHLIHFLKKNEEKNKSFAWDKEVKGSRKLSSPTAWPAGARIITCWK